MAMSWIAQRISIGLAVLGLVFVNPSHGADHLDSPSVRVDGSLDINDLYAFQSPTNPNNVVFIVTLNPLAGVLSGTTLNPAGVYEINVDTNGNGTAEHVFRFYFSAARRGVQRFVVTQSNGAALGNGQTGQVTQLRGGGNVTVGVFEDPFFFDLNGFNNGLAFTGMDFFAGANVTAIAIEIPRSTLGSNNIGVWASTVIQGRQFDRKGRPAINTVLLPSALKNRFNATQPVNDMANFGSAVRTSLLGLGNSPDRAATLLAVLLPDILTVDTSSNAGFLNGRQPSNDVIDAELSLLTNGAVTGDRVNANDKPFPSEFPYLAAAN